MTHHHPTRHPTFPGPEYHDVPGGAVYPPHPGKGRHPYIQVNRRATCLPYQFALFSRLDRQGVGAALALHEFLNSAEARAQREKEQQEERQRREQEKARLEREREQEKARIQRERERKQARRAACDRARNEARQTARGKAAQAGTREPPKPPKPRNPDASRHHRKARLDTRPTHRAECAA